MNIERIDGRACNQGRPVKITRHFTCHAPGSVLIEVGNTKVICTAMVDEKVPSFMRGEGRGWISAEYEMLPSATGTRKSRDRNKGKVDGRTTEIQRLIGRSLRSIVNLEALGERTIWIDCDVIQADGGTRTASITGAYIALQDAVADLMQKGSIKTNPITGYVAAISVGIWEDTPILDLCYHEDSNAIVDMNVVMTDQGELIEIQGTGEARPFTKNEFNALLNLGEQGVMQLIEMQKAALAQED